MLLLLGAALTGRAQSSDQEQAMQDRALLDTRMERLLTDERLTTGFLLDYGLQLTDLSGYNCPAAVPDSVVSDPAQFRRAYALS